MEGVLVDQKILNDLIEIILPEVSNKLKFLNIDCSIFSIQWFVCLFSRNLDRRIFEIFIDNLVVEGSIVLFKTSIVILKFLEKKILAAKDFCNLAIFILLISLFYFLLTSDLNKIILFSI